MTIAPARIAVSKFAPVLAILAGLTGATPLLAEDARPAIAGAELENIERALQSVSSTSTSLTFAARDAPVPRGGHLQGIQFLWDAAGKRIIAILSHDSDTVAYLVIAELPADLQGEGRLLRIHELPSDGGSPPLRHAGGFQLADDALAIGLEDNQLKTRSEIQFWDLVKPNEPRQLNHLTIRRSGAAKEQTAGAVGLLRRSTDHLLCVANWDSQAIDFYVSNGKLLGDPQCRFVHSSRWQAAAADRGDWLPDQVCGAYQSIQLVADARGAVHLLGFQTNLAGIDSVDLFAVEPSKEPSKLLRKVASKRMALRDDNHFVHAGGASIHAGELWILSGPRNLERSTAINFAKPAR